MTPFVHTCVPTGSPDWTVVCWNWNKSKALAAVQVSESSPCSSVSFSPLDASVIAVTGTEKVSFYRLDTAANNLRPIPSTPTTVTALCHVWLKVPSDHLVIGTDTGSILVYDKSTYLTSLKESPVNLLNPADPLNPEAEQSTENGCTVDR